LLGEFVVEITDEEEDRAATEDERDARGHEERKREVTGSGDQHPGDDRRERAPTLPPKFCSETSEEST